MIENSDQQHRDNVVSRYLIGFMMAISLGVLSWIGFNTAESRVDIATIKTKLDASINNYDNIKKSVDKNSMDIANTTNILSVLIVHVEEMNKQFNDHVASINKNKEK